jgi:hypothetical protein
MTVKGNNTKLYFMKVEKVVEKGMLVLTYTFCSGVIQMQVG